MRKNMDRPRRSAPSVLAVSLVIVAALGAMWAFASTASAKRGGRVIIRSAKVIDTDTTYGDGVFNLAHGFARCKNSERVVGGGPQLVKLDGLFGGANRISLIASGPIPKKHGWEVDWSSDLGGAARQDFKVLVECQQ